MRPRLVDGVEAMTAAELLAGSSVIHEVEVPHEVLRPGASPTPSERPHLLRVRPLSIGMLTLISRAARDDAGLVPLLVIKEALVEPALSLEQVRSLHVGLVDFLVRAIHRVSGLAEDGAALDSAAESTIGRTHLVLAKHFGWSPEQVAALTPGQVAIYLAGIDQLMRMEAQHAHDD